jgi:hypothetical protein
MRTPFQDGTARFGALQVGARFSQRALVREHFKLQRHAPSNRQYFFHMRGYNLKTAVDMANISRELGLVVR